MCIGIFVLVFIPRNAYIIYTLCTLIFILVHTINMLQTHIFNTKSRGRKGAHRTELAIATVKETESNNGTRFIISRFSQFPKDIKQTCKYEMFLFKSQLT